VSVDQAVLDAAVSDGVAATLRAARALIADPKHWTKGVLAKPSKHAGYACSPTDERAGAWCAIGALARVDGPYEVEALITLATAGFPDGDTISSAMRARDYIVEFNDDDGRRHRDIMRLFDRAIARAEALS
jgi:hypothetical protein